MPFYEYECSGCGHCLEAMQKISDGPLKKCPKCGRNTLKRLMSAPVFRLKGGGWYETDFKGDKDGRRNLAGEKDEAPKVAEAGAEQASDKAAEKPAAQPKPEKAADKPSGKTIVPVKRPAAAKAAAAARKPTPRKPTPRKAPSSARSARR
jgi:putative FmdB family regulatory protein